MVYLLVPMDKLVRVDQVQLARQLFQIQFLIDNLIKQTSKHPNQISEQLKDVQIVVQAILLYGFGLSIYVRGYNYCLRGYIARFVLRHLYICLIRPVPDAFLNSQFP